MAKSVTNDPFAPSYWNQACDHLVAVSDQWCQLIMKFPDRALRSRGKPFETLVRSVIGQQISVKAAETVWRKLVDALGDELNAMVLGQADPNLLRQAGLSRQKITYLAALCDFDQQGGLDLSLLNRLSDEQVVQHLIQVKGIGQWTAHMLMIFSLMRPNIWPVDDAGLRKAICIVFNHGQPINRKQAADFGSTVTPWRTVACWYLWRSLDPNVVDY